MAAYAIMRDQSNGALAWREDGKHYVSTAGSRVLWHWKFLKLEIFCRSDFLSRIVTMSVPDRLKEENRIIKLAIARGFCWKIQSTYLQAFYGHRSAQSSKKLWTLAKVGILRMNVGRKFTPEKTLIPINCCVINRIFWKQSWNRRSEFEWNGETITANTSGGPLLEQRICD